MKEYKMPITDKHLIPNILDHSILIGYWFNQASYKYLLEAENLVFNKLGIRQCDNRLYDDLHEDYIEISEKEFLEL